MDAMHAYPDAPMHAMREDPIIDLWFAATQACKPQIEVRVQTLFLIRGGTRPHNREIEVRIQTVWIPMPFG